MWRARRISALYDPSLYQQLMSSSLGQSASCAAGFLWIILGSRWICYLLLMWRSWGDHGSRVCRFPGHCFRHLRSLVSIAISSYSVGGHAILVVFSELRWTCTTHSSRSVLRPVIFPSFLRNLDSDVIITFAELPRMSGTKGLSSSNSNGYVERCE